MGQYYRPQQMTKHNTAWEIVEKSRYKNKQLDWKFLNEKVQVRGYHSEGQLPWHQEFSETSLGLEIRS